MGVLDAALPAHALRGAGIESLEHRSIRGDARAIPRLDRGALEPAVPPTAVTARDVLEYLEYLRRERDNGAAAVNRTVTILRSFYRAIVAMGHLEPADNPLAGFPSIKAAPRKLPVVLDREEVGRLLATPQLDALCSACAIERCWLCFTAPAFGRASAQVFAKGKSICLPSPLPCEAKAVTSVRSPLTRKLPHGFASTSRCAELALPSAPFFRSRFGKPIGRGTVYERVRTLARRARLAKPMSPHRLRHTFASHLVREGVGLVTIRDLLGHRLITSTQIYLHVTAQDLRAAAERHPIARLLGTIEHLLPHVRLPFQRPGARCATA